MAVLLQGIGLSLEEALIFWRAEFTKLMDVDKVFYNKLVPPNSHSQKCHKFGEIKFLSQNWKWSPHFNLLVFILYHMANNLLSIFSLTSSMLTTFVTTMERKAKEQTIHHTAAWRSSCQILLVLGIIMVFFKVYFWVIIRFNFKYP